MGTSKKGAMAKDTVIYMLAKGIEGVVGVVTMSVMTYLFCDFPNGSLLNSKHCHYYNRYGSHTMARTVCFKICK